MSTTDPQSLSLPALRSLRTELQQLDDAISYVRRLAQARLDRKSTRLNSSHRT